MVGGGAKTAAWRQVTPEEAVRHPLYGLGGWLLFFLVLQTLGLVVGFVETLQETILASDFLSMGIGGAGVWYALWLFATWAALIYGAVATAMGYARHPGFPEHVVKAMAVQILASLCALKFTDLLRTYQLLAPSEAGPLYGIIALEIAVCALLIWYYRASARVQVTYLHRVGPYDSHGLAATVAGTPPASTPPPSPVPAAPMAATPLAASAPQTHAARSVQERLTELKALREGGLIDEAAYRERQVAILRDL